MKKRKKKRKTKKAKKLTKKDILHVRIEKPIDFRKKTLKSAIDATSLLKNYESYKILKEEKMKKIVELNSTLKEIHHLMGELKNKNLPIVKEIEEEIQKEEKRRAKKISQFSKVKVQIKKPKDIEKPALIKRPDTEMSRLDKELEEIKLKLSRLEI
jgi:hypothetical protein